MKRIGAGHHSFARRLGLLLCLALGAAATVAPPSALALTAVESGAGVAVFGGDGADDSVTVSQVTVSMQDYLKIDDVAPVISGGDCASDVNGDALCLASGVTPLAVNTGFGNDSITVGPSVSAAVNAVLQGGDGDDQLSGGAGNDLLDGGFGSDTMSGGTGTDAVSYAARTFPVKARIQPSVSGPDATGRSGNRDDGQAVRDTIASDVENLIGGSADDRLCGNDLANTLDGHEGDDILAGGAGPDSLVGGAGNDTASYADHTEAVTATIGTSGNGNLDDGAGDTIASSNENLTGGASNDSLTGDSGANVLDGGPGADTMAGGGASYPQLDAVSYASHIDGVNAAIGVPGASGNDSDGLPGARDSIANNIWELVGSDDSDALTGNGTINILDGGEGDDTLDGGFGPDWLIGGNGVDAVTYENRSTGVIVDISSTGAGPQPSNDGNADDGSIQFRDLVDLSVENVIGTAQSDTITGNDAGNAFLGGHGADHLSGSGGADSLDGGPGRDELHGGPGGDLLIGGHGPDKLFGGGADDRLDAVDGKKDRRIDCGGGEADRAKLDGRDPEPLGCEKVSSP